MVQENDLEVDLRPVKPALRILELWAGALSVARALTGGIAKQSFVTR